MTDHTSTPEPPWLAIAAAGLLLAALTVGGLAAVEPPGAPPAPVSVAHNPVDLGDWAPFAPDAGTGSPDAAPTD